MVKPPWVSGPSEILEHGILLLKKASDKNRRLAMIAIDNAVELTIKTYLGLPHRVTGVKLSKKDFMEISETFPRLLDALEKHASDKLRGIDLGEIEWFHRVRNELYHQGNGLTVVRDRVVTYSELARLLFKNLFGFDVEISDGEGHELLGRFLAAWVRFEKASAVLIAEKANSTVRFQFPYLIRQLAEIKLLDSDTIKEIEEFRAVRNRVVHGEIDSSHILTDVMVSRLNRIADVIEALS